MAKDKSLGKSADQLRRWQRAFSLEDLAEIEARLVAQGNSHDLALLSFGLDTMLRSSDLLSTKVWQIKYTNGPIRTLIARRQRKTRHIVNPVLTLLTRRYLMACIELSGKSRQDYVFNDIIRMKENEALMLYSNRLPVLLKTKRYYQRGDLRRRSKRAVAPLPQNPSVQPRLIQL